MKNVLFTLALLFVATITACSNDDAPTPTVEYTDAESFFTSIGFQGAVMVKQNGNIILNNAYGEANLAQHLHNTSDTKFRIGSVSKTLTAMGLVQLKRDGLIVNYDQKLSEFHDEFPFGNEITLRHLLSHQSGLPDYVATIEPLAKGGNNITPEDILDVIIESVEEDGLLFTPGTQMSYSNSNFLLAALLIEALSETTYEAYITSNVLQPLGMSNTELGSDEVTETGYAHGYKGTQDVSAYPMQIAFGAGNWTSTTADMTKWCEAVMGDWFSDQEKDEIFYGNVPAESTIFGLGWFKSNIAGKEFYWHGGDIDGFTALIGFVPSSQGVVVALSNQGNQSSQRNQIIETLLNHQF